MHAYAAIALANKAANYTTLAILFTQEVNVSSFKQIDIIHPFPRECGKISMWIIPPPDRSVIILFLNHGLTGKDELLLREL